MTVKRALYLLLRALHILIGIVATVMVAKACQYAAVAQWGDRIGFDLASWIGLAPAIVVVLFVANRLRRRREG